MPTYEEWLCELLGVSDNIQILQGITIDTTKLLRLAAVRKNNPVSWDAHNVIEEYICKYLLV